MHARTWVLHRVLCCFLKKVGCDSYFCSSSAQPFTHNPATSNRESGPKQTLFLSGSISTSSHNGTAPFPEPTGTCTLSLSWDSLQPSSLPTSWGIF